MIPNQSRGYIMCVYLLLEQDKKKNSLRHTIYKFVRKHSKTKKFLIKV